MRLRTEDFLSQIGWIAVFALYRCDEGLGLFATAHYDHEAAVNEFGSDIRALPASDSAQLSHCRYVAISALHWSLSRGFRDEHSGYPVQLRVRRSNPGVQP